MVNNNEKKKILLVDDNTIQLEIIEILLKNEYDITAVKSGNEALDCFCHGLVPNLILLDIAMPNLDEGETFSKLKAKSSLHNAPIVFLTPFNEKADMDRTYETGTADFIMRPYEKDDLLNRIKTILEKPRPESMGAGG